MKPHSAKHPAFERESSRTRRECRSLALLLSLTLLLLGGCASVANVEHVVLPPGAAARLDPAATYVKVHFADGRLAVLANWRVDPESRRVGGTGPLLSAARDTLSRGFMDFPIDSVALFETNVTRPSAVIGPLAVVTVASVALSIYCASHPKDCFGSCPTFYTVGASGEQLRAEGFSSSVAPSLEATDIDALDPELLLDSDTSDDSRAIDLVMRNEAYETHVVRSVRLLVAEHGDEGRVVRQVRGPLRRIDHLVPPASAHGPEGTITDALLLADGRERRSTADSSDLAAAEEIVVTFPNPGAGDLGLVLVSRQTLLPTFLFYKALALMGSNFAPWLARFEAKGADLRGSVPRIWDELGGIEAWVEDAGTWRSAGSVVETGPLATDAVMIPLGPVHRSAAVGDAAPDDSVRVRLRMARGAWRIDQVALGRIGEVVEPIALDPARVSRIDPDGREATDDAARDLLRPEGESLVTFPGDAYRLHFELPCPRGRAELLLESRGYYLEWMREGWKSEEDPKAAMALFLDPRGMLRRLAPEFKSIEAEQERLFWASRYARHD